MMSALLLWAHCRMNEISAWETLDEENMAVLQLLAHKWIWSHNYTLDPSDRVTAPSAAHY